MQLIRFLRAIIALHPRPEVRGFTANEVNIEKPYSKRLLFRIFYLKLTKYRIDTKRCVNRTLTTQTSIL